MIAVFFARIEAKHLDNVVRCFTLCIVITIIIGLFTPIDGLGFH